MSNEKYRLLILATHPVQYVSPQMRMLANHPKLDVLVAYLDLRGAKPFADPGFGIEVSWDVPLLEGYRWIKLGEKDRSEQKVSRLEVHRQIWNLIKSGKFDVLYVCGYNFSEAWAALLSAKRNHVGIIFHTDAHRLQTPNTHSRLGLQIKRMVLPHVFGLAGGVLVSSTGGLNYVKSLGVDESRIFLGGSVVDNNWWTARAQEVDRAAVRRSWEVPVDAPVVLFCAKLQRLKRPWDLVEAFARAGVADSHLVFAGDGHLRKNLERQAANLGVADRVHFLGFVNQSALAGVYVASDLMVLPSEYESFGVVVNEAMLCGCPVIVSDRVGAKYDLIREGQTGYVYDHGDVPALTQLLRNLLSHPEELRRMGAAAIERMKTWTPEYNIEMWVAAIEKAVATSKNHS